MAAESTTTTDGEGVSEVRFSLFGAPGEGAEGATDADEATKDAEISSTGPDGDESGNQTAELTLDGPGGNEDEGKPPPFNDHPAWKRLHAKFDRVRGELGKEREGRSTDQARIGELTEQLDALRGLYPEAADDLLGSVQEDVDIVDELNRLIEAGDPTARELGQKILDGVRRGSRSGRGRARGASRSTASAAKGATGSAAESERKAARQERAEYLLEDIFAKNGVTKLRGQIRKGVISALDFAKPPTREKVLETVNGFLQDEGLTESDIIGRKSRRATPPSGGTGAAARAAAKESEKGGKPKEGASRPKAKSALEAQSNRTKHMADLLKSAIGRGDART